MRTAFFVGCLGIGLSVFFGQHLLNWEMTTILSAVLASNVGALSALFLTLRMEKMEWIRNLGALRSWTLLSSTYAGILLLLIPSLRDSESFAILLFPLILSTGFAIIMFGPIQDSWMRRKQKAIAHQNQGEFRYGN